MPKYDLENLEKTLKNEGKFGENPAHAYVYTKLALVLLSPEYLWSMRA